MIDWEKPFPIARINRADLTEFGFTDEQIATVFTDEVMAEITATMEGSYHMNFGFWEDFRRAIRSMGHGKTRGDCSASRVDCCLVYTVLQ